MVIVDLQHVVDDDAGTMIYPIDTRSLFAIVDIGAFKPLNMRTDSFELFLNLRELELIARPVFLRRIHSLFRFAAVPPEFEVGCDLFD